MNEREQARVTNLYRRVAYWRSIAHALAVTAGGGGSSNEKLNSAAANVDRRTVDLTASMLERQDDAVHPLADKTEERRSGEPPPG